MVRLNSPLHKSDAGHLPNQLAPTIDSFISQASDLLQQFKNFRLRYKSFGKNPAVSLLAEVGGAIGKDLVGSQLGRVIGRAFTKGYLESQESQQLSLEAQRLNTSFLMLMAGIRAFLSSVSVAKRSIRPSGNSEMLLRRLRKVDEATRFDAKLRRVASILNGIREEPLIYNSGIQQWLEQEKRRDVEVGEPYTTMKRLETNLRSFISSKLGSIDGNWWTGRVPQDVREHAELRKAKNERLYPWESGQEIHPMAFVDFPDYAKVILRRDNWDQAFSATFGDKEAISTKLRELEPIRNAIAHFRTVGRDQETKLKLYAGEILRDLASEIAS